MSNTRGHFEGLFGALPERPDRRAYRRSNSALLTYVELGDGNGGIALNVSEGGLAITAAGLLTSDYFPNIRFQLPKSDVWIETSGQVAWASDSKKGAGIQFVDVADSDRGKIRDWIATKDSSNLPLHGTSETVRERDREFLGIRSASKLPMKLEVLSEADEAKFAGMFPSEKTLPSAHHEREGLTPDADPQMAEQSSRNVLRFLGRNLERDERTDAPTTVKPADDRRTQSETVLAPPNDGHSVEGETPQPSNFPEENLLVVPRVDDFCERQELRADDSALAQPENAIPEPTHNHSVERKSLTPPDFLEESTLLAAETDESSEIEEGAARGKEQEPPAYVFSREADLIQQLELHRRNRAANLVLDREREVLVEGRSGWPLAVVVLLIGIACFAVGVGVGNGFFDRLLGHNQESERPSDATPPTPMASLPAATAGENDFAGASAVASNAQIPTEVASGNSTATPPNNTADRAASDSPAGSESNPPVQVAPTRAANANSGDGGNLAEKDTNVSNDAPGNSPGNSLSSDAAAGGAANDPGAKPGTTAISPAGAVTAQPFSETQSPILVTAPDEKSGPFRLTLAEQAVSASRTLAISAQRFVSVPAQPGPASGHRPERLQVGVLIFHVDPQVPSGGNQKEIAGTVKVRATIGKSGDVVDVKPISGPVALIPAVVQAVREWRYTVTLLDGQPLGAEEDVVIEFRPKS
jgi:PilZ domain/Gram-negative bacterial TonB protein C-terminal